MWVPSLSWEDPLQKVIATHSSILARENSMGRGSWQAMGRLGCSVQGLGPDLVSELAGKAGGLKSCFSGSGEPQRHFLSSL